LAFLIALETLSPTQRAVLLLRDVFDYSVAETADALELSEANVKTTLHRARQAMSSYDAQRCIPSASLHKRTRRTLQLFLLYLATDNVRGIESLLREDVVEVMDSADDYVAARRWLAGREKVVLFNRKIMQLVRHESPSARVGIVDLNSLPALVSVYEPVRVDFAPRQVFALWLDEHGRIRQLHSVLAHKKLGRVPFDNLRATSWLSRALLGTLRALFTRLQRREQRLSPHIQVHAGSRARSK
jgi:RNA polymerase sigma-70 factor (ECF subfamily)